MPNESATSSKRLGFRNMSWKGSRKRSRVGPLNDNEDRPRYPVNTMSTITL